MDDEPVRGPAIAVARPQPGEATPTTPASPTAAVLELDLSRRVLKVAGRSAFPTKLEWAVLGCLIAHAGEVVTYEQLADSVWGPGHGDMRASLRGHVKGLRAKLTDHRTTTRSTYIRTENSAGYRWVGPVPSGAPAYDLETVIALAEAVSVVSFNLDGALAILRGQRWDDDHAYLEMLGKLDHSLVTARRAQTVVHSMLDRR